MGEGCLTVRKAWTAYDRWLRDPKVDFLHDSAAVDIMFRRATAHVSETSAPKALGDCYLLALSLASQAELVTLDRGLAQLAGRMDQEAVLLE